MRYAPTPLGTAVFYSGQTQLEIAKKAEIHYTRLNKLVKGWLPASDREKKALARVLRKPVEELFPEVAA